MSEFHLPRKLRHTVLLVLLGCGADDSTAPSKDTGTETGATCEELSQAELPHFVPTHCDESMTVAEAPELVDGIPLTIVTDQQSVPVSCGRLMVAEDRSSTPATGCVELPVAVVSRWGDEPAADP